MSVYTLAHYERHRLRRGDESTKRPHKTGYLVNKTIVAVDVKALRAQLAADPRSMNRVEADAGLSSGALYRVLSRGRCTASTFDAICSALGLHGYEIEEVA